MVEGLASFGREVADVLAAVTGGENDVARVALLFFPFVVFFEMPLQALVLAGVLRHWDRRRFFGDSPASRAYYPSVSCLVTCYAEGMDVRKTIRTLAHQIYPGTIEILALVDSAEKNAATLQAAHSMASEVNSVPNRELRVVPKPVRGGRVSSLNSGFSLSRGEVLLALDGDTSFENRVVLNMTAPFEDPNVVGVAGNLRVRNSRASLWTRLQTLEYMLSITLAKTGLGEFNVINNISGAFGAFRRSFLAVVGGWDSGSAEDLDLTTRIKNYFGRYPALKIVFAPEATGYTDAPATLGAFLRQRLRWDGDLYYIYVRKYWRSFNRRLLGWKNLLLYVWLGLFFQLVMPFVMVLYTAAMFFFFPPAFAVAVNLLIYCFYLAVTAVFFAFYLAFVSPDRRRDLPAFAMIPLYPLFAFFCRVWNAVSTLAEIFTRAHLDSGMAPWWVLRKTKF